MNLALSDDRGAEGGVPKSRGSGATTGDPRRRGVEDSPKDPAHGPGSKRCAVCREVRAPSEMLRFARSGESEWLWDPSGKAGGRGMSVCADLACLRKLKIRGVLETLTAELGRFVLNELGLWRRRQRLVLGAEPTIARLRAGATLPLIVAAVDVSPRTRGDVERAGGRVMTVPVDGGELGHALGAGVVGIAAIDALEPASLVARAALWSNLAEKSKNKIGVGNG